MARAARLTPARTVRMARARAAATLALVWAMTGLTVVAAPLAAQSALHVDAGNGATRTFSRAQLEALARDTLRTEGGHAPPATFQVVSVGRLLSEVGITLDSLRSGDLRRVVLAEARDGYTVVFSLGELSKPLGAQSLWIAVRREGLEIPESEGPFRLLVPGDTRGARAVRQLERLRVVTVDTTRRSTQPSQRSSRSATKRSSRSQG